MRSLSTYPKMSILVGLTLFFIALGGCSNEPVASAEAGTLIVYKTPQCGCCDKWVAHMRDAGFDLTVKEKNDLSSLKNVYGISARYQSCHTAVTATEQYVFEGHIPARIIQQFLSEPPADAKGLIVPGMPIGSPGMEQGARRDPYDVLLLKGDGEVEVYSRVGGGAGA